MAISRLDAQLLKKAFLAGAARLESQKERINELNVFPVPDGDTGTNMTLTAMSAVKAVIMVEHPTIESIAKAMSSGSLRGARGNSGVILSQLLRGFCKEITAHADNVNVSVLASAFDKASETAYKAVMKPKEGTILTVAKGGADKALELEGTTDDIAKFFGEVLSHMEKVLASTPELLPVLKEAGVVDSGGAGLIEVLKGAYDVILGKVVPLADGNITTAQVSSGKSGITDDIETADIKFGYCTEFIIMSEKEFTAKDEADFKHYLEGLGDCIVVVADDEIVKVHVHTNDPGLAIQKALTYGQLTSMKIDNMREEHHERVIENATQIANREKEAEKEAKKAANEPKKKDGFIAVSAGSGLSEIFKGLGVDFVLEGGQTMNPSTDDILNAIDKVNAENIFILPNNKNIILAANQAKELTEDKNIIVIPSKTVPQGISAVINYVNDGDVEENTEKMTDALQYTKSGEVTYAVRDTAIDGKSISQGNIMGIGDEGIISVCDSVDRAVLEMLDHLVDGDSSIISLYYGNDVSESAANALSEKVAGIYKGLDIEVHFGGQPVYYYLLSVE
ncbi:DAK2 domain-containing protein [Catonella massiliensis]|uniref:DAK2 domain-containing protein n=1 Tax=Catonella massiliensis TaxID=2799636 RepID=A0ABS1J134_9FIRM|nr:DAK2 domain-containing protein [Catonella massiliensis]MBK5897765.1 DAK2 domain-containing protein [Catonella massiliensis]